MQPWLRSLWLLILVLAPSLSLAQSSDEVAPEQLVTMTFEKSIFLNDAIADIPESSTNLVGVMPAFHDQRGLFLLEEGVTMTRAEFVDVFRDEFRTFLAASLDNIQRVSQEHAGVGMPSASRTAADFLTQWEWLEEEDGIPIGGVVVEPEGVIYVLDAVPHGLISSVQELTRDELAGPTLPSWVPFQSEDAPMVNAVENPSGPSLDRHSGAGWTPYRGTTDLQKDYIYNWFVFNNTSAFGSASTYEHETIVYNKGFASLPLWAWSNSNLPRSYKECLEQDDDYDKFAMGTLQATDIRKEVWYYTFQDISPENAPSSNAQINGQIGHRSPSWMYACWFVYGDTECQFMKQFTAPKYFPWSRTTCYD